MKNSFNLIPLFISIAIGNIVLEISSNIITNVWVSRSIGCIVCVLAYLILNNLWVRASEKHKQ